MINFIERISKPSTFKKSFLFFWRKIVCLLLIILLYTSCDLGVENPGPIPDDALNNPKAMEPLVVGMASDFSEAFVDIAYFMGIASRDIYHTGVFEGEQFMQEGRILPRHVSNSDQGDLWAKMHRARSSAERGVERMQEVLGDDFESSPLAIRAYTWIGYSNRLLGEHVCQAVIDGGSAQSFEVHFERAEEAFTNAIQLAKQQNAGDLLDRAYSGRAQVRLALQDWDGASSDASNVSDDFVFEAVYSLNSTREENWLSNQSNVRSYFSVYGTFAAEKKSDPRIDWEDMNETGVDGETPFYLQKKYANNGSNIELSKWDEMLLVEAEAALRNNDLTTGMEKINEERSRYGLEEKVASNIDEAWSILRSEREIILWMEGRRLWDLRRFDDPFLEGRDRCMPIGKSELDTNENL